MRPGESPEIFGDALRHLARSATYLYQDKLRYWYSTQPTIAKLAEDRAEQLKRDPDTIAEEINKRVQEDLQSRGDVLAIRAFPKNHGKIPDEMETQLVILGVDYAYAKELVIQHKHRRKPYWMRAAIRIATTEAYASATKHER